MKRKKVMVSYTLTHEQKQKLKEVTEHRRRTSPEFVINQSETIGFLIDEFHKTI